MRSPSQRWRDSISECVPPRLVAFVISRVAVDDVEREQPAEAGIADDLHRRMGFQPPREPARGRGLSLDADAERLQAP